METLQTHILSNVLHWQPPFQNLEPMLYAENGALIDNQHMGFLGQAKFPKRSQFSSLLFSGCET